MVVLTSLMVDKHMVLVAEVQVEMVMEQLLQRFNWWCWSEIQYTTVDELPLSMVVVVVELEIQLVDLVVIMVVVMVVVLLDMAWGDLEQ